MTHTNDLEVARLLNLIPDTIKSGHLQTASAIVTTRSYLKSAFDIASHVGAVAIKIGTVDDDGADKACLFLKMPEGTIVNEENVTEFKWTPSADFGSRLQQRLEEWGAYQGEDELLPRVKDKWWAVVDRVRLERSACDPKLDAVFLALDRESDLARAQSPKPSSTRRPRG